MSRVRPTVAGIKVPIWAEALVRVLFFAALVGIGWQIVQLQAASSAPARPSAQAAAPAPAPKARPAALLPGQPFPIRRRLNLERELLHGDYVWQEAGAPPGRVWVLVDLSTETLSVFRGGVEIGRAIILYGTDEQPTPLGTFSITEKDADHESNIYDAQMPYMLRLTDDGIAIHGSVVVRGSASRGCVGIPDEFAALLFAQARLGDRVTIVRSAPAPAVAPERIAVY